ncbi:TetR/AcrR family transcriptional regulator [Phenylobacterium sp. LjRoot219]|uniref:TetR/AcrR family transcriptional regulator n=1 Tax=Phenylobacterium sp. LjRoot219 TaxID=3342283 RepID=UPI003ECE0EF3
MRKATQASRARKPEAVAAGAVATDRRGEILQIAARRFAEYGYESTTIRELADDAKILSGSIYHHFATKDEILHEIVRDAVLALRDETIRVSRAAADAEHRMVAVILLHLGVLIRDQDVHAILYNERKFFRRNPAFEYVALARGDMYLGWRAIFEDGVRAGQFRADLDPFLAVSTIIRMVNTCADWFKQDGVYALESGRDYRLDQVIDFNLNFVLSAIRTPERVAAPVPRAECEALARRP